MVRCNMCMEVYSDYDVFECSECKTNAYLMDLSPEEVEEYV